MGNLNSNDILHSITKEKQQEAAKMGQFLTKEMKGQSPQGGNWDDVTQAQKLVIMLAFCIEYGRRTPDKWQN